MPPVETDVREVVPDLKRRAWTNCTN